jgi:curved DNA-binding protein CbpA
LAAIEQDHYTVLGVPESATTVEIRTAYRRAVRSCHPDLNPTDAAAVERFKAVQRAYEVLSDPRRRAAYRRPIRFRPGLASTVRPVGRPSPASDLRSTVPPDLWETLSAARVIARRRLGRRFRQLIRYLEGL